MKTDLQLQSDVLAELQWDPPVHAARIGVDVKDGVVTLSSSPASALTVRLPGPSPHSDADIAAAVAHRLGWHAALENTSLGVLVDGGWVSLTGAVRWPYQRQAAVACVLPLRGVMGVHDNIRLLPGSSPGVVMSGLRAALERASGVDARLIQALVAGHDVTLTGTVPDWAGRQSALAAAWAMPGVRQVQDRMTLAN